MNACSAAVALVLPLSAEGRALIVALGVLVLAAEALNTGIEAAVDHTSSERSDLARYAKDAASAGVALTAVAAGLAWVFLIAGVVAGSPA
ncbi:diacylglycerol kinase (ATP) [Litoreibacter ponti]|uniref:Diacylglycerol kinase (ATP) n=2 Tax=Litoreibacter ponti TaxID=1510457 RepID=A0A2T6BL15_9RHOB|nr:diacylglycerol kinase (ATP) [Litoreibacter ponti]